MHANAMARLSGHDVLSMVMDPDFDSGGESEIEEVDSFPLPRDDFDLSPSPSPLPSPSPSPSPSPPSSAEQGRGRSGRGRRGRGRGRGGGHTSGARDRSPILGKIKN